MKPPPEKPVVDDPDVVPWQSPFFDLGWTFCGLIPEDQRWVDWQPVASMAELKTLTRNALEGS